MTVPGGAVASRGSVIHIKNEENFSVSRSLEDEDVVPSVAVRYLLSFEFKHSVFFCTHLTFKKYDDESAGRRLCQFYGSKIYVALDTWGEKVSLKFLG